MIPADRLNELSRPCAWRSWLAILREWSVILLCFWLVARAPHWGTWRWPMWIACFILLGRQNYALLQLTHEAAHCHLFISKKWNDFIGQWLCAAPSTFNMHSFRLFHLRHHAVPLTAEDPDFRFTAGYPISKASLRRKMLRDLTGLTNLRGHVKGGFNFFRFSRKDASLFYQYGSTLLVLMGMQAAFLLAGHGLEFLVFWILPAATVGVFFFRIAVISAHGGLAPNADQSLCTRTVVNRFEAFWVAPYNAGYHLEHHLFPRAPFFNLPKIHQLLARSDSPPSRKIYGSYLEVLREIVR